MAEIDCPECGSSKVFLCSGGFYICNDCEWFIKEKDYANEGT